MASNIFQVAYHLTADERFVHRYIHSLFKEGKRDVSFEVYSRLKNSKKDVINPYIIYKGVIECDEDLDELELLITGYINEGSFHVSNELIKLLKSASEYLRNEISKVDSLIETINQLPEEEWTKALVDEYNAHVIRRLFLIQKHIIVIQSPEYLDEYLEDIERYVMQ